MAKILLVEDDKSLREIYGVRLMAEGYEIVSAGDGEEALAMAIKEHPDLIVSDVMMPKISGFDMLDILRSTTETKGVKVIMMTALSSDDQRARGEALGADRYLVKSQVGIEDVVRTVHDVLADTTPARTGTDPVAPAEPTAFGAPAPVAAPDPTPVADPALSAPSLSPFAAAAPAADPAPAPAPVSPAPITTPDPIAPAPVTPPAAPAATPVPAPAAPTEAPFSLPVPPSEAVAPAAAPADPTPSVLPEPTAPFSSPAPASLGDRIIAPLSPEASGTNDIAALMSQELSGAGAPVPPTAPVTPAVDTTLPPTPPTPPLPPMPTQPV